MRSYRKYFVLCFAALLFGLWSCDQGAGAKDEPTTKEAQTTTTAIGSYTLDIPSTWKSWGTGELRELNKQFGEQQKAIYQRYAGAADPSIASPLLAYRTPTGANFLCVVLSIPPQADLMGDLKKEAPDKAKWGIENGFIKRASEVVPVKREGFDGFYLETESTKGSHDFMGGLAHASRKTEVIQLMLTDAPESSNPRQTFEALLATVKLSQTRKE